MRLLLNATIIVICTTGCSRKSARSTSDETQRQNVEMQTLSLTGQLDSVTSMQTSTFAKPCADRPGNSFPNEGNLCTGNLINQLTLDPVGLVLVHNSQGTNITTGFGLGWQLVLERQLEVTGNVATVTYGDGTQIKYSKQLNEKFRADDPRRGRSYLIQAGGAYEEWSPGRAVIAYHLDATGTYRMHAFKNGTQTTTYLRNDAGRIEKIQMPYNTDIALSYIDGVAKKVTFNEDGATVHSLDLEYTSSSSPRISKVFFPDGRFASISYNSNGTISAHKALDGTRLQYEYVNGTSVSKIIEDDGNATIFAYSSTRVGMATTAGTLIEEYTAQGTKINLSKVVRDSLPTVMEWDADGRLTRVEDYTGRVMTLSYAKESLEISHCGQRNIATEARTKMPSRFLKEIDPNFVVSSAGAASIKQSLEDRKKETMSKLSSFRQTLRPG